VGSMVLYVPGRTFFHKLDPRAKIVFLVLVSTSIFTVRNIPLALIGLGVMVALWGLARLPWKILYGLLKTLVGIFIFLFIIQSIFYPGEQILVKPLIPNFIPLIGGAGKIAMEGISFAFLLIVRLLTMIILMPLVSMTTPVQNLALGLAKMGLPYHISFTITSALNMVPILQSEVSIIMDAQKLRAMRIYEKGKIMEKFKSYTALVTPLVIGAMRRAQSMAVAMDSRAFGAMKTRSYLQDIHLSRVDWVFITGTVAYSVGTIIVAALLPQL